MQIIVKRADEENERAQIFCVCLQLRKAIIGVVEANGAASAQIDDRETQQTEQFELRVGGRERRTLRVLTLGIVEATKKCRVHADQIVNLRRKITPKQRFCCAQLDHLLNLKKTFCSSA